MKKEDIEAIAQRVATILVDRQNSTKKDSLGRKSRERIYNDSCLFYLNKEDHRKFTELVTNKSEVLRAKVREVLKEHGVVPVDKG